jgi:hypothetical protein
MENNFSKEIPVTTVMQQGKRLFVCKIMQKMVIGKGEIQEKSIKTVQHKQLTKLRVDQASHIFLSSIII